MHRCGRTPAAVPRCAAASCGTCSGHLGLPVICSSPKSSSSPGPSKDHIALADTEFRGDLRHTSHVHPEIAEHFVRRSADRMAARAIALPKEDQGPALFRVTTSHSSRPRANLSMGASARTTVNSNSAIARPNIVKSIGAPAATVGNSAPKSCRYWALPFSRFNTSCRIGSLRKPEPSGNGTSATQTIVELVEARTDCALRPVEAGDFDKLGGRNVRLCDQQMLDDRIVGGEPSCALGQGKEEALRIVEWVARRRRKAPVPHQVRVERRVHDRRCAALIPWAGPIRADDQIILHANRDGLRVAKAVCGRMAARAGIVIVKAARTVEE